MRVAVKANVWRESGVTSRRTMVWLVVSSVIGAVLLGVWWNFHLKHKIARSRWKIATLSQLAGISLANEDIRRELDEMKAGPTNNVNWGWTHENVLLMTNGQYLVYAFRHGFNSGSVDHLFLARSSDDRWLYSTYHFCNRMTAAQFDDAPGSIAEFQARYAVLEFDGSAAGCSKRTWPVKK